MNQMYREMRRLRTSTQDGVQHIASILQGQSNRPEGLKNVHNKIINS